MVNLYINLQHFLCSTRCYSLNSSFIYFQKLHDIPTSNMELSHLLEIVASCNLSSSGIHHRCAAGKKVDFCLYFLCMCTTDWTLNFNQTMHVDQLHSDQTPAHLVKFLTNCSAKKEYTCSITTVMISVN